MWMCVGVDVGGMYRVGRSRSRITHTPGEGGERVMYIAEKNHHKSKNES